MSIVQHGRLLKLFRLAVTLLIALVCSQLPECTHGSSNVSEVSRCQNLDPSPLLPQFVDQLPTPQRIFVDSKQVTLGAYKITQKLHRDLPETTLYAFGKSEETAAYPGPTLIATAGVEARVRWENHIHDDHHFLTVDTSLMWANPGKRGGVPLVVHLHGAEAESGSDGHPDAWYTADGEYGHSYTTQNYTYANSQRPAMLWYHDHAIGMTRLNVVAGMAGLYIIRPNEKRPSWMPMGKFDVPLLLQDKQFFQNGSINFPNIGMAPKAHPSWCPEYFGDTILVNGKVWPYMYVQPRKYRFRILNGANARFFVLSLSDQRVSFLQIGTDGGLLHQPQELPTVMMAPAERIDVIIDFSLVAGSEVVMNNSGPAPFPLGDPAFSPPSTRAVLKFKVKQHTSKNDRKDVDAIPKTLTATAPVISTENAVVRILHMQEWDNKKGNPISLLLSNRSWIDPVTEMPVKGSTEVWEFINLTPDAHPMHIHLVQFLVVNQQSFSWDRYFSNASCSFTLPYPDPKSCYTEEPRSPTPNQIGWKDTVVTLPGVATRLVMQWISQDGGRDFPFDATAGPGYVWHCHLLDHEDNDMMRPIRLITAP